MNQNPDQCWQPSIVAKDILHRQSHQCIRRSISSDNGTEQAGSGRSITIKEVLQTSTDISTSLCTDQGVRQNCSTSHSSLPNISAGSLNNGEVFEFWLKELKKYRGNKPVFDAILSKLIKFKEDSLIESQISVEDQDGKVSSATSNEVSRSVQAVEIDS